MVVVSCDHLLSKDEPTGKMLYRDVGLMAMKWLAVYWFLVDTNILQYSNSNNQTPSSRVKRENLGL